MQRPGADTANMQVSDFWCDFCRAPWDGLGPMVEGHQGSLICGKCLSVAYRALELDDAPTAPPGYTCTLCLEERPDPGWRSPAHDEASVCTRCVKQAAGTLAKDKDVPWEKPAR